MTYPRRRIGVRTLESGPGARIWITAEESAGERSAVAVGSNVIAGGSGVGKTSVGSGVALASGVGAAGETTGSSVADGVERTGMRSGVASGRGVPFEVQAVIRRMDRKSSADLRAMLELYCSLHKFNLPPVWHRREVVVYLSSAIFLPLYFSAECAAARRAIGTRKGEQET